MVEKVYKSRAEAPTVLPFTPLTELEALFASVELDVASKYDVVRVARGGSLKLAADQLALLGLTLDLECAPAQMGVAIETNGLASDDVLFAAVGSEPKGGHLKRTDVLWTGRVDELSTVLDLQKRGAPRKAVLQNAHDGYDIRFVAIFTGSPSGPLKPRRAATILAESTYRILPIPRSSGMQPWELTPQARKDEDLGAGAWLYVKRTGSLHDSARLEEALEIYVDPKVLRRAAAQPSSVRPFAESLFAVPALIQLAYHLSQDLMSDDAFEWDGRGSEALTLVQDTLHRCGKKLSAAELVSELRTDPARVASIISGFAGQKERIIAALESDTEGGDDGIPSD